MASPRARTDGLLALGVLVALVAGVVVLGAVGSRGSDPFEVRRSTLLGTPYGARALHDLLHELGYDVRRHRESLRSVPPETGTLCILSTPVPFGRDEIRGVDAWVQSGGTLVLSLGGGTLAPVASLANTGAPGAALAEAFEIRSMRVPQTEMGLLLRGDLAAMEDIERVRFRGGRVLEGGLLGRPGFAPLVIGPHGTVAGAAPWGRGRVVVFADDTALTNRYLRDLDNARMLVVLLAHRGRVGPILFDERHQGYGDDREAVGRLTDALSATGLGLVLLQAGLAAGCMLYGAGRRFGAALPPPRARRRAATEAAAALGEAYREAGAASLAAETLAAGARRRAAGRLGIPPTLPPEEFVARLRTSRAPGASDLAAALERAAAVTGSGRAAERALADAAGDLERALDKVGKGAS